MVERLGWTLVHFVWQGCAVAALLALVLPFMRGASASVRYGLACAVLLLLACFPFVTFLVLAPLSISADGGGTTWTAGETILGTARPTVGRLPLLVQVWAVGVTVLSLRLAGTLIQVERWRRRHTRPAESAWQERLDALARRLGVVRPVRFLVSERIGVPSAWGVLRPLIVLPASLLAGLPSEQVESILLHELAHVRRHDYLVNLAQTVVETILFYHPAVWWVSAVVRREREHCCDDAVVVALGDPMPYARALLHLEERRQILPHPTLSAKEGNLMNRIARILGAKPTPIRLSPLAPILAALGVAVLVSGGAFQANAQSPAKTASKKPVAKAKPKVRKATIKVAPKALAKPVPTLRLIPLTKPTLLAKPASKTAVAIVADANGKTYAADGAASAQSQMWSYPTAIARKTTTVSALSRSSQKSVAGPITTTKNSTLTFSLSKASGTAVLKDGLVKTQSGTPTLGSAVLASQAQIPAFIQGGTVYRRSGAINGRSATVSGLGGSAFGDLSSAQSGARSALGGGQAGGFGSVQDGGGLGRKGLGNLLGGGAFGSQNRAFRTLGGFGAALIPPGNLKAMMDAIVVETRTAGHVSVDLDHAPLAMTLRKLAKQTGLSIVIGKGSYGNLTMVLNDLPVERALGILCRAADANLRQEAGVWFVEPPTEGPVTFSGATDFYQFAPSHSGTTKSITLKGSVGGRNR